MYEFSRALINARLERLLNFANCKKSGEKCLNCGSSDVTIVDFKSRRRYCSIACMKEYREYIEVYFIQD